MVKFPAYPTLDGLVDLACRDGIDVRPTLLRVLTDLYIQKPFHSADEEIQYVELALRLIEGVDAATRAIVAARLSNYSAAPAAVLAKLAAGVPSPSSASAHMARSEPESPSGRELADLFFAADAHERRLILMTLDAVIGPARVKPVPTSAEIMRRLENAALERKASEFMLALERALGIARGLAERIVADPSGEPIVVAAKALGMKAAVVQRILLLLNPSIGQSVERVYDLARLFDEIPATAAERMVAIWRQAGGRRPVRHEAFMWDDERKHTRILATPLPHRAVRRDSTQSGKSRRPG
jgi:uncharacterized protein (DUF2336 family)